MGTLYDYLTWRGDLSFAQDPLNEVDSLIFSLLSYIEFGGIVPAGHSSTPVSVRAAANSFFARNPDPRRISMGVMVPKEIIRLLRVARECRRFRSVGMKGYVNRIDTEVQTQFSATTFCLDTGETVVAYRGTDDTLVGWKENFNMSFLDVVPAQAYAAAYLNEAAEHCPGRLYVAGHSKGGNLAVYAAIHCRPEVRSRLVQVWCNDGPGFRTAWFRNPDYLEVQTRIRTLVPQSSVVGMLLEHDDNYYVVQSSQQGLNQHDGFSWQVLGPAFVPAEERSQEGRVNEKAIRGFFANLDDSQRRMFVDAMFEVLGSTNAQTLTELDSDRFKSLTAMAKTFKDLDRESRQVLGEALRTILKASTDNLKEGLEEKGQELRRLWENKKQ